MFYANCNGRQCGNLSAINETERRIAALREALSGSRDWLRLSDEQASPGYAKRQVEKARQVINAALAAEEQYAKEGK